MKNGEFRILIAILALVVALGLFLGGFTIYNKLGIEEPLTEQLQKIADVEKVDINKDKLYNIQVELNNVNDLQEVYQNLVTIIETKLNADDYKLVIIDKPNAKLSEISIKLQPAIYEALANNEFMWLDETLAKNLKDDASYNLFVDENYIYIKLVDQESYIYKVLERPSEAKAKL